MSSFRNRLLILLIIVISLAFLAIVNEPAETAANPSPTASAIYTPQINWVKPPANVTYTNKTYTIYWSGPEADRITLYYMLGGKETFVINVVGTSNYTHWNPPDTPDPAHPSQSVFHQVRLKAVWQKRLSGGSYENLSTAQSDYFTLAHPGALVILNQSLPPAYTGQAYRPKLQAEGGNKPYHWQIVSGSLPSGLSFSNSGQINGTPQDVGSRTVRFRVTDASVDILEDMVDLQIAVVEPGQPTSAPRPFDYWLRLDSSDMVTTTNVDRPATGQVTVRKTLTIGGAGDNFRTVTLDAAGAPAGVDVSFSPRSGLPHLTSAMNITVHNDAAPGAYTLTISGTTESGMVRTLQHRLNISTSATGGDLVLAAPYKPSHLAANNSILAVQVFDTPHDLVKGKNTLFRTTVGSTFATDMDVEVELWLSTADWVWDGMPVNSSRSLRTGEMGTYTFPEHYVYSRIITVPANGEVEIWMPDLGELTVETVHTSGHGYNDELDIVANAPKPRHSGGDDYTDEPKYTVVVDPYDRISESSERNNVPFRGFETEQTHPAASLSTFYTPLISEEYEIDDFWAGGVEGTAFNDDFRQNIWPQVRNSSEFMLGVFPIADDQYTYFLQRGILVIDRTNQISIQMTMSDMAAEMGYDRIVGMVPAGFNGAGGSDGWSGVVWSSNRRACFVLIDPDNYKTITHEYYHNLGYGDVYGDLPVWASDGYWVNKQARYTIHGVADGLRDYMDYWGYTQYWTGKLRYDTVRRSMPDLEDPEVLLFRCMLYKNGSLELKPFMIVDGKPDPDAEHWNYRIVLKDARGQVVRDLKVNASFVVHIDATKGGLSGTMPVDETFISSTITWSDDVSTVELRDRDDQLLVSRAVSRSAPSVRITEPGTGSTWRSGEKYSVKWEASDPDSDQLYFSLSMSKDNATWIPVAMDVTAREYSFNTKTVEPGSYYFRVRATDGVRSSTDVMQEPVRITASGAGAKPSSSPGPTAVSNQSGVGGQASPVPWGAGSLAGTLAAIALAAAAVAARRRNL